jgi:hypothetical protein
MQEPAAVDALEMGPPVKPEKKRRKPVPSTTKARQ